MRSRTESGSTTSSKSDSRRKSEGICRVDLDDDGIHVDDVAISGDLIKMFRLEDMGGGQFWGAVYLRDGRDLRFSFDGSKARSIKVIAEWDGRAISPSEASAGNLPPDEQNNPTLSPEAEKGS